MSQPNKKNQLPEGYTERELAYQIGRKMIGKRHSDKSKYTRKKKHKNNNTNP